MDTPDLTTKAGRKAWRHDMRMVAVRLRRAGMILLAVGIGTMLLPLAGVHDVGGWSPRVLGLVPVAHSSSPHACCAGGGYDSALGLVRRCK